MTWLWIIGAMLAVIAGIGLVQHRRASGTYRTLASRQPQRRAEEVPLGMEAIDFDGLNSAVRRNESLERGHTNWTNRGGMAAATDVPAMPDDATYAQRYHTAFIKNKKHKDQAR